MFERFTERARKVLVLAQDEAGHLRHEYIGTEHLLLGLLREGEGVAARALYAAGITLGAAREQVEGIMGYGEEDTAQKPFTPRSKKVLQLALRESLQLGHDYIGTEHILLGLMRESEGVAARVLSNLDVDPDKVRRGVLSMLIGRPGSGPLDEDDVSEAAGNEMLFRERVGSLRATGRLDGRLGTLIVDLDYTYVVQDAEDTAGMVGHHELLTGVLAVLEARELRSIEVGVSRVGERVLEGFPAVREVTVGVTDGRVLEDHAVSAFTVSRSFKR